MKTLALYTVVLLLSAGMAWWFVKSVDEDKIDDKAKQQASGIADPLWYRRLSTEDRLASAEFRLDRMASSVVAAKDIGPIKDEVALLCIDEAVVDLIVERFHATPKRELPRLSAYLELFGRVKHRKFALLFIEMINTEGFVAQINALEAARVQASPQAIPMLRAAFVDAEDETKRRILSALAAINTGAALNEIKRVLPHLDRESTVVALQTLSERDYVEALPQVTALLDHKDPDIRTLSAFTLARFGRRKGREELIKHARDRSLEGPSRAQAVQLLRNLDPKGSVPVLRDLLEDSSSLVSAEALIGLVRMKVPEVLLQAEEWLGSTDGEKRSQALTALGRVGGAREVGLVEDRLLRLNAQDFEIFATALHLGSNSEGPAFLDRVVRGSSAHSVAAIRHFHGFGSASLPYIKKLAQDESKTEQLADYARAVASVVDPESKNILMEMKVPPSEKQLLYYVRTGIQRLDMDLLKLGFREDS